MYVDSHCHLDGPKFEADRGEALKRALDAGVEAAVLIGNGDGPDDVACALEIAEQHDPVQPPCHRRVPRLYATIGIHPHEARLARDEHYKKMSQLAAHHRVIAWGEIGLDYWYDHSPRDVQRNVFIHQMVRAGEAKLPIVIHCRPSGETTDAWDDCLTLIERHWKPSGLGGILHCFTGQLEHARAALDMGFMISFAGNVSFPKAQNIRDAAKEVPLDRMLIETDSPYLAPVPHRGKRNEPAFVALTAKHIAELRGTTAEEIGAATSRNFRRFFSIDY